MIRAIQKIDAERKVLMDELFAVDIRLEEKKNAWADESEIEALEADFEEIIQVILSKLKSLEKITDEYETSFGRKLEALKKEFEALLEKADL
ncbi:unnamed protein product [Linum trigynum]|uniref:Uncharacterized protein n=1 Tax=Linum trigynum TaxID=586398 RepID=A0AAV2FZ39_9ROSI